MLTKPIDLDSPRIRQQMSDGARSLLKVRSPVPNRILRSGTRGLADSWAANQAFAGNDLLLARFARCGWWDTTLYWHLVAMQILGTPQSCIPFEACCCV